MSLFLVTPTDTRTPKARIAATDVYDLGTKIAAHLARHRVLTRGVPYDAQIGTDRGAIRQTGRVVTFTITQES